MRNIIKYLGQAPVFSTDKAETFTLTSGYDSSNSAFVRVSDGLAVGADPTLLRVGESLQTRHIKGEGYLYCSRPGYVFATFKGGMNGWSNPWLVSDGHYQVARISKGFETEIIDISERVDEDGEISLHIQRPIPNSEAEEVYLGCYIHQGEPVNVTAIPFKGLKSLLGQLFHAYGAKQGLIAHGETGEFLDFPNGSYYCRPAKGSEFLILSDGRFIFADDNYEDSYRKVLATLHSEYLAEGREVVSIDDRAFLIKLENRYFLVYKSYDKHDGFAVVLKNSGWCVDEVEHAYSYETTKEVWDGLAAKYGVSRLAYVLENRLPEQMHPVVAKAINYGGLKHWVFGQLHQLTVDPELHVRRDAQIQREDKKGEKVDVNVLAVYTHLESMAEQGCVDTLATLMTASYTTENIKEPSYKYEGDRMLGHYIHHCLEHGHDVVAMFDKAMDVAEVKGMADLVNEHLVFFTDQRYSRPNKNRNNDVLYKRVYAERGIVWVHYIHDGSWGYRDKWNEVTEEEAQDFIKSL